MQEYLEIFQRNFPFIVREEDSILHILKNENNRFIGKRDENGRLIGLSVVNQNTILLLCVDQEYRKQGIGTGLLAESESIIREAGFAEIVVGVGFSYLMPGVPTSRRYFDAVNEALDLIYVKQERSIVVKTKERSVKLTFDSILYVETAKRVVIYHLAGGKSAESLSMRSGFQESIADLLSDKRFALCGASAAVNLDHVTEVESEAVVFDGTDKVFFGKKACKSLRNIWSDYLVDAEG